MKAFLVSIRFDYHTNCYLTQLNRLLNAIGILAWMHKYIRYKVGDEITLSSPKRQRYRQCRLGMDKWFHSSRDCDYSSIDLDQNCTVSMEGAFLLYSILL